MLTKSATGCADPVLSQPFKAWLDSRTTSRSTRDFESGADGWTLTGGAKVVDGNAAQHVGGAADASSLLLPAGSSATSPPVCVGLDEPTLRYFARKNSGLLSTLTVSVQVQLAARPVGDAADRRRPRRRAGTRSLPSLVIANLLPLLPPDMTAVRFKFAPMLGGAWQIDDVYVDPRMSRELSSAYRAGG